MNGFKKPSGLRPSANRTPLRSETIPAKAGAEALEPHQSMSNELGLLSNIPCAANPDLGALVDDREVVSLSSNVWESAAVGVV